MTSRERAGVIGAAHGLSNRAVDAIRREIDAAVAEAVAAAKETEGFVVCSVHGQWQPVTCLKCSAEAVTAAVEERNRLAQDAERWRKFQARVIELGLDGDK